MEEYQGAPGNYDLIIVDLMMPHMSGIELGRLVRDIDPSQPILLTSGFANEKAISDAEALGITHFLKKPFTRHDLAAAIRRTNPVSTTAGP